ncbi:MAG: acetyl-CoA carboxylase biotin carboxyl carrier protein [Pseudomonadota bacterium]
MPKSLDEDLHIVRELADVLNDTGLTEVELERGGLRLRVARNIQQTVLEQPHVAAVAAAPVAAAPAPMAAEAAPVAASPAGETIRSPMVGTAYLSPTPGAAQFVDVGGEVTEGQTLMIVEAMKTMNEIKAPRAGKVLEILAKNAEPVEFDEALIVLEA